MPAISSSFISTGQFYKYFTVAAQIIISNKCPIIAEQVVVIFMTSLVTIATAEWVKTPLIFALSAYNPKTGLVTPIFYDGIMISMLRYNFLQSFKKFCIVGSEPP